VLQTSRDLSKSAIKHAVNAIQKCGECYIVEQKPYLIAFFRCNLNRKYYVHHLWSIKRLL